MRVSGGFGLPVWIMVLGGVLWMLSIPLSQAEDTQAWMSQASAAVQRGDFKTAEKQYRRVLREAPDEPNAQLGLASTLMAEQRTTEARVILEALVRKKPDFQPAYYLLGMAYEAGGDMSRARAAYQAYVSSNPSRVSSDPQVRIKLRQMGVF
jgi:cytochrome c-type biogenesis protein CcmH/NrfG